MSTYPRIDSPCPLRFERPIDAAGFHCGQCQRHVYNLSAMTQAERDAFLLTCDGSVCVSYAVPRIWAMARASVALTTTMLISGAALAQSAAPQGLQDALLGIVDGDRVTQLAPGQPRYETIEVFGGGVTDPRNAARIEFADDATPELPMVDDEAGASPSLPVPFAVTPPRR